MSCRLFADRLVQEGRDAIDITLHKLLHLVLHALCRVADYELESDFGVTLVNGAQLKILLKGVGNILPLDDSVVEHCHALIVDRRENSCARRWIKL